MIDSYLRSRGLISSSLLSTVPRRSEAERLLPEIQGPVVLLTPVHCARRSEADRFLPEIQGFFVNSPCSCLLCHGGQRLKGSYLKSRGLLSSSLLSSVPWRPEAERFLPEIQGPVVFFAPVFCAAEARG